MNKFIVIFFVYSICLKSIYILIGIYYYLFDRKESHLSLREFDDKMKRKKYEEQKGICPLCKGTPNENKVWDYSEMQGDHIIPWSRGGKTTMDNLQMLCRYCNNTKSDR